MDSLVTTEWLSRALAEPDLVVLDCTVNVTQTADGELRSVSGRADYDDGHIPSAGFADLLGDLRDTSSPLEGALPTPEQFCATMGELGVGDDSRVIVYDGNMSVWAARVWWMLRWVGFDRAAVLDGGQVAWEIEGRPLSTEPAAHPARRLTPAPRPGLIADLEEVLRAVDDPAVRIIDTMPAEHYRGDWTLYARPGHIPGASSNPVTDLLDEAGRFRSPDELAAILEGDRSTRAITYCGGGFAASASAFAMTRLGFTDVAVYAASLEEWAADPANPMVTGSA